jgi:hypothetical protein
MEDDLQRPNPESDNGQEMAYYEAVPAVLGGAIGVANGFYAPTVGGVLGYGFIARYTPAPPPDDSTMLSASGPYVTLTGIGVSTLLPLGSYLIYGWDNTFTKGLTYGTAGTLAGMAFLYRDMLAEQITEGRTPDQVGDGTTQNGSQSQ